MYNAVMPFPLAYMLSWRCYGTWLHGDPRGSVDRDHNEFNTPLLDPDPARQRSDRSYIKGFPMLLTDAMRDIVDRTIRDHCRIRGWEPLAINVRTNHVHTVVACGELKPEVAMTQFKSWGTRRLREAACIAKEASVWAKHGSTRYLWRRVDVEGAVKYVVDMQ